MRALAPLAMVVLLAAGCGGGEEAAGDLPLGKQISAKASANPTVHLFAEPVVAELEVVVDRDHLDPARVEVETEFLPYDVKQSARSREDRGRFTVLSYEYLLRCLRIACIPPILPSDAGEAESGRGERHAMRLPAAQVRYDDPDGEARTLTKAAWPELVSVSRIKQSDVPSFGFVFKTSVTPLPEPDYRVSPTLLGAGLLAGALALLAVPATLIVVSLRRRRPPPPAPERELTPLERAVRLVEWSQAREDGAERREALELLASELEAVERPALAENARALAWSPVSPSEDASARLLEEVKSDGGT
jgi:hypothetical protein